MKISYCIPNHNRTDDLEMVIESVVKAANYSPPVEIVILDYGSTDGCAAVYNEYKNKAEMIYSRYESDGYIMAHARNLASLVSTGEYIFTTGADVVLPENIFKQLRDIIENKHPRFIYPLQDRMHGLSIIQRSLFMEIGGFDERFVYYGPEDKDLINRALRATLNVARYSLDGIELIPTPKDKKHENYRTTLSINDRKIAMHKIFNENNEAGVIRVNLNGWGVR